MEDNKIKPYLLKKMVFLCRGFWQCVLMMGMMDKSYAIYIDSDQMIDDTFLNIYFDEK